MTDTKENILTAALHLFAENGYEAVSVSTIAGALSMTKGALYKHYKNKRDIFDRIVERMYQLDAQRSRQYEVPGEKYETEPTSYENVSTEQIRNFTVAQFTFWAEDPFASDFRKMLTLEQYRNAQVAELYSNCLAGGPTSYMEDIFREMMKKGTIKEADPRLLAVEYYAPFTLLLSMSDRSDDKKSVLALLNHHIERFFEVNAVN